MSRNIRPERGTSPNASSSNHMDVSKHGRHDSLDNERTTKTAVPHKRAATVSKHNAKRSANPQHPRGSDDSSIEDEDNADEEDSSSEHDADDEDAEEPEANAPSDGTPQFTRQQSVDDVDTADVRRAGQIDGGAGVSKKRSFSQAKHSILSEADAAAESLAAYPRKQTQRRLSNNHGLFTYDSDVADADNAPHSAVVASDDDDDDYAAVDLISDSEDDEEIERRESKAIAAQPESDDDSDDSDLDLGIDPGSVAGFFDEQMDLMPEDANLMLYRMASPLPQTPVTRKVHFDDTAASPRSSSDTSSENGGIPDLFSDSAVSLTAIQSAFSFGYEAFNNSPTHSDDSSYWDWQGDDFSAAQSLFTASEPGDASTDALSAPTEGAESGYDTDASGDTTEEDMPPPPPPNTTPKATLRSYKAPVRRAPPRHSSRVTRRLPRFGTFSVDVSKPYAYHKRGVGLVVRLPKDTGADHSRFWPSRSDASTTAQSSPVTPFQSFPAEDSDYSDVTRSAFSGTHGVDLMLSGLFGGDASQTYHFGGQIMGPPEMFFPFKTVNRSGSIHSWDDESYDDDAESDIDLNELLNIDGDDEDLAMASLMDETPAEESENFEPTSPAATETSSAMTPFHSHTNSFAGDTTWTEYSMTTQTYSVSSGVVNSFRNNQDRAKLLSRIPNDPAERVTMSQAIRNGYAADSFISPLRKRKPARSEQMPGGRMSRDRVDKSKSARSPRKLRKLPPRGFFT